MRTAPELHVVRGEGLLRLGEYVVGGRGVGDQDRDQEDGQELAEALDQHDRRQPRPVRAADVEELEQRHAEVAGFEFRGWGVEEGLVSMSGAGACGR